MEYIKDDLKYSEIGGVYVYEGKPWGWKLLSNDDDLSAVGQGLNNFIDFYIDNVVDPTIEPIKQMQPHVIIRPRQGVFAAKKQNRRVFVTTYQLQQQQKKKAIQTRSSLQAVTRKSPRLNKVQATPDRLESEKAVAAKRKLDLPDHSREEEKMGENKLKDCDLPPPPPLTEYEMQKAVRVKRNNEIFFALNLPTLSVEVRNSMEKVKGKGKGKEKEQAGSDDEYDPGEDNTAISEEDVGSATKAKKRKAEKSKVLIGRGPTTRSRANVASKKLQHVEPVTEHMPDPVIEHVEPSLLEIVPDPSEARGSMEAFWAMRKRQKEEEAAAKASEAAAKASEAAKKASAAAKTSSAPKDSTTANASGAGSVNAEENISPEIEQDEEAVEVPKRPRGKTRMDKVHARTSDKRVVLQMNERFQAVSDDSKISAELSNFLGTLAKRCVSFTYVSWRDVPKSLKNTMWNYVKQRYIIPDECETWVLDTIHASWRCRKSRIKEAHYKAYPTDEERLEHRPDDIPLESFKMLLAYWNDESIQYKARKNARSRSKYAETHIAGPRSFAQIRNEMTKEADGTAPSDAEVFVKTRKRNPGREYKTDTKKIKEKDDIEKQIKISGDGTDELLLSGGKKHGKTWLYGRCPNAAKVPRSTSSGNSYVEDLACKIKESLAEDVKESVSKQVQEEVDAQVNKKVQQNLTLALKKIAEANPGIKINMEDFCPTASSDDENGTPITGGASC